MNRLKFVAVALGFSQALTAQKNTEERTVTVSGKCPVCGWEAENGKYTTWWVRNAGMKTARIIRCQKCSVAFFIDKV
jgi:hypothetical protein